MGNRVGCSRLIYNHCLIFLLLYLCSIWSGITQVSWKVPAHCAGYSAAYLCGRLQLRPEGLNALTSVFLGLSPSIQEPRQGGKLVCKFSIEIEVGYVDASKQQPGLRTTVKVLEISAVCFRKY